MIVLRSLVFNVLFYLNLTGFMILSLWSLLFDRRVGMALLKTWARSSLWLLKVICGIHMEVRGIDNIPHGAALIAGKHQSFWESFALLPLLDDPCMVLKRELLLIPLFGWYGFKFRMIAVARGAGAQALRDMVKRAKQEVASGRQIVIMPEGTRKAPGDAPDYKPGAAALYTMLKVPCVPFGLNAGLFWPRRKFLRYPGTITIAFLPAIPSGLSRDAFQTRLVHDIEQSSDSLAREAGFERVKQN